MNREMGDLKIFILKGVWGIVIIIGGIAIPFYLGKCVTDAGIFVSSDIAEFWFFMGQVFFAIILIFVLSVISSKFLKR